MLDYYYCIASSFIVSYACSYFLLKNSDKLKWGKKAYIERVKLHKKGVPRLGGIALYIAFFFTLFSMLLLEKSYFNLSAIKLAGIFIGATIILVVGVYDDLIKRLGYRIKFLSQVLAIIIVAVSGYNISIITNPFGGQIYVGVFGIFFVILFMLTIINAINLIDGLDGLACGVSLIAVIGFFIIGLTRSQNFTLIITASLIGAMLAFLKYNFYPAKLFLLVCNTKKRLTYIAEPHQDDVYCFHIAIILLYSKVTLIRLLSLLFSGKNSVGLSNLGFCNFPCFIHYKFYTIAS